MEPCHCGPGPVFLFLGVPPHPGIPGTQGHLCSCAEVQKLLCGALAQIAGSVWAAPHTLLYQVQSCELLYHKKASVRGSLAQVAGGVWADTYGGKQVLGFGVVWWSLATVLTPLAARMGLPMLLFARACMGIGEVSQGWYTTGYTRGISQVSQDWGYTTWYTTGYTRGCTLVHGRLCHGCTA